MLSLHKICICFINYGSQTQGIFNILFPFIWSNLALLKVGFDSFVSVIWYRYMRFSPMQIAYSTHQSWALTSTVGDVILPPSPDHGKKNLHVDIFQFLQYREHNSYQYGNEEKKCIVDLKLCCQTYCASWTLYYIAFTVSGLLCWFTCSVKLYRTLLTTADISNWYHSILIVVVAGVGKPLKEWVIENKIFVFLNWFPSIENCFKCIFCNKWKKEVLRFLLVKGQLSLDGFYILIFILTLVSLYCIITENQMYLFFITNV